jgi:hypothetical protein
MSLLKKKGHIESLMRSKKCQRFFNNCSVLHCVSEFVISHSLLASKFLFDDLLQYCSVKYFFYPKFTKIEHWAKLGVGPKIKVSENPF